MSGLCLRSGSFTVTLAVFLITSAVFDCQTAAAAIYVGFILHQALGSLFLSKSEVMWQPVSRGRDKDSKLQNFFQVTVIRGEQEF